MSAPVGPQFPGSALLEVVAVMDRLRSPGGCAWDAAQTHASLAPYAVEEGHEVAEAAEAGDPAALRGELGDLLLQVVFHARVAQEHADEPFGIDDVATTLVAKLRRRHPHVFAAGDGPAPDADGVAAGWEVVKAAERGDRSAFDGVPVALPALQRAHKVLQRAERVGADVPAAAVVPAGGDLGDHLLALVQGARERGEDAEASLRAAVRRLEDGARAVEHSARAAEITPETEDWTWVLQRPCPQCGLDASAVAVADLPGRLIASAATWRPRLLGPDPARRPTPTTWSPLEHGAHVRDVLRLAHVRLSLLLEQEDPVFADGDQDATAVQDRYAEQDPARVATEVGRAAEELAALLGQLPPSEDASPRQRPGRRSNGSKVTVASLGRYVLHDLVHHEQDVAAAAPGPAADDGP